MRARFRDAGGFDAVSTSVSAVISAVYGTSEADVAENESNLIQVHARGGYYPVIFKSRVCVRARRTGAAARESLRRDRPLYSGKLPRLADVACASACSGVIVAPKLFHNCLYRELNTDNPRLSVRSKWRVCTA